VTKVRREIIKLYNFQLAREFSIQVYNSLETSNTSSFIILRRAKIAISKSSDSKMLILEIWMDNRSFELTLLALNESLVRSAVNT